MREIEPQPVGRVQRSALRHMIPQRAPQRLMQQMRRRMVGANGGAARRINHQFRTRTHRDHPLGHPRQVQNHPLRLPCVDNLCLPAVGFQPAVIADLPTGFGIERRLVDDHQHLGTHPGLGHRLTAQHQRDHLPLGSFGVIAQKFGGPVFFRQIEPDRRFGGFAGPSPGRPRLGFLPGHRRVKPGHVNRAALFAQRILRQVQRKPIGVIKLERRPAIQRTAIGQAQNLILQQLQPAVEGGAEPGFLQPQGLFDQRLRPAQLGVSRPHAAHQSADQPVHHRVSGPQLMRMPHGAAHDAAQHITAPFIRRHHPVSNQE